MTDAADPTRATAAAGYFATVRSMSTDPELLASVDRAEAAVAAGPRCSRCGREGSAEVLICGGHGVCFDCEDADEPTNAPIKGETMTTQAEPDICGIHGTFTCICLTRATYTDTYPLDYNGWAVVSRPFIHIRADEVVVGDLLILDSGLSRVTGTKRYDLLNGVTTVHITGPTNIVRATHETVTVLRDGT